MTFVVCIFLIGMLQPHCFCCCVKPPRDDQPEDTSYRTLQTILWCVQTALYLILAAALAVLGIGYFVPPGLLVCSAILTALNPLWACVCAEACKDNTPGMTAKEIELMKKQRMLATMG